MRNGYSRGACSAFFQGLHLWLQEQQGAEPTLPCAAHVPTVINDPVLPARLPPALPVRPAEAERSLQVAGNRDRPAWSAHGEEKRERCPASLPRSDRPLTLCTLTGLSALLIGINVLFLKSSNHFQAFLPPSDPVNTLFTPKHRVSPASPPVSAVCRHTQHM